MVLRFIAPEPACDALRVDEVKPAVAELNPVGILSFEARALAIRSMQEIIAGAGDTIRKREHII
jgi:hypothetical protein